LPRSRYPRLAHPHPSFCPTPYQGFDPSTESYGHGNNKTGETKKSILHPDLKTIPRVPQVQLIGNGVVYNHEGLAEVGVAPFGSIDKDIDIHAAYNFMIGQAQAPSSQDISQDCHS
jgi:hypothetical protein